MKAQRIAIVGYGIAGIAAAIALRHRGHEVVHFERGASGAPSGAGLLLNGEGLAALARLGLRDAALSRGAVIDRVEGRTCSGRPLMDLRYDELAAGNHGLGIQRQVLFELLRDADPGAGQLRTGQRIVGVWGQQNVIVEKTAGPLGGFDLVVAADGANSMLRAGAEHLLLHDRLCPQAAAVCLLDDPDGIGAGRLLQTFAGTRHASCWPVGLGRIAAALNTPAGEADVSPVWADWRRSVSALCPPLGPLLQRQRREPRLILYRYRDVALRRFHTGRLVFIGDAAHSMSPQLGLGASMALVDALALADAIDASDQIAEALDRYDETRRASAAAHQRLNRWLTPVFQSQNRWLAALRDRAFFPASRLPGIRRSMLQVMSGRAPELSRIAASP